METILDRAIGYFSPMRGLMRMQARATIQQLESYGGQIQGGYNAGRRDRGRGVPPPSLSENSVPLELVRNTRSLAWEAYRNNPLARKAVRTLDAKVIGKGPQPHSEAIGKDGEPWYEFRDRAHALWDRFARNCDYRGKPGKGGQTFSGLARTALRSLVLSGEVLYQRVQIGPEEQARRGCQLPLLIRLWHSEQLADDDTWASADRTLYPMVHRGIELRSDGTRAAYYLWPTHPSDDLFGTEEPTRVPAEEIGHVYLPEDVDAMRGASWFAPVLDYLRDVTDFQANELKAAAINSCVALLVKGMTGSTAGLRAPSGADTVDRDSNPISYIQPGMIFYGDEETDLQGFSPNRPTTNAEGFIQHITRGVASGLPGVRPSSLTGDYRQASFASEKSAENDCWPEIEQVQGMLADQFYSPIWEMVLSQAVLDGWFEGIITPGDFATNRFELSAVSWGSPVARSINPTDDAEAASLRVKAGVSSPQAEAASVNVDWRSVLDDIDQFLEYGRERGLPEEMLLAMVGHEPKPARAPMAGAGAKNKPQEPQEASA